MFSDIDNTFDNDEFVSKDCNHGDFYNDVTGRPKITFTFQNYCRLLPHIKF